MKNIVVWDGDARYEFLQTREPNGSALRIRSLTRSDGRWSLTAEARQSATAMGYDDERTRSREDHNTLDRPAVPSHVAAEAERRAGAGAKHVPWPGTRADLIGLDVGRG